MTQWLNGSLIRIAALTALALLAGCIGRHVLISQPGITCLEAQRLATETVGRMGYTITDSVKATPGKPGLVVGSRGEGDEKRGLLVTVTCTKLGAEVEATTEESGLASVGVTSEFQRTFQAVVANRPPPRPAATSGLDVLLTPQLGATDLGVDVNAAEVLPVSVRISNRTPRPYRFRAREVVLETASGERVRPLSAAELTSRLGAQAASAVEPRTLHDQDIGPGAVITGYLFFPSNSYSRAHVELLDRESDESEGFSIEF